MDTEYINAFLSARNFWAGNWYIRTYIRSTPYIPGHPGATIHTHSRLSEGLQMVEAGA